MKTSNKKPQIRAHGSAGFQTCRIADFPVGRPSDGAPSTGSETCDTADLAICAPKTAGGDNTPDAQSSEVLILSDGQVLAHNLTPAFADLLHQLNPEDPHFAARRAASASLPHPVPRRARSGPSTRTRRTTKPKPHP